MNHLTKEVEGIVRESFASMPFGISACDIIGVDKRGELQQETLWRRRQGPPMSKKRSTVIPPFGSPGCAGGSTEGGCAPSLEVNQCDGCVAGYPRDADNLHRLPDGTLFMSCDRDRYDSRERPEGPTKAIRSVIDQERSALDHPLWEEKE